MKLTTLSIVIALSCAACSEGDMQLSIEKVDAVEKSSSSGSVSEQEINTQETPREPKSTIDKAIISRQETKPSPSLAIKPTNNAGSSDTNKAEENATASIEIVKDKSTSSDAIDPSLISELEASLATIDDAKLSETLNEKSSAIDLQMGVTSFSNGPVNLAVSKRDIVSKVSSVSGATSITGDPTGFGFTVALSGDYLFDFDKASLTPKAEAALQSVLTLYQEYDGKEISVAGHTDSKGSNEYNKALSVRRADSVKAWFTQNKIDASNISTQGYGETKPIADNSLNGQDYPAGRALNRRVDISVQTQKKINHLPTVSSPSGIK